ncbi:hypothetical protein Gpo141_00012754 [Globisporangium polare]
MDTAALLPLSPIKHSSTNLQQSVPAPHQSPKTFNISAGTSESQQQNPKQAQYLQRLDDPENVELFAYASTLCHRITGRYLPKALLQNDAEAQKREIERMQRDPEIVKAIATIRTLSKQFKDVARDTMGHRKELGHALFRIEESYLKLFEKLLEISLRMYWKYEQERESERAADKASIVHWKELHSWKKAECVKLQKLNEAKDIVLKTQQIQIHDLEQQVDEVNSELTAQRDLEHQVHELTRVKDELRHKERELQVELSSLQKKHEDMVAYERNQQELMREQQKHIMDEMRHALREKDAQILKQDLAIRELSVEPIPVVYVANSSQTEVDDDGLWDVQDGIPRFVSKSALHRMLWRRFNAFVTCKNCHGRPIANSKKNAGDERNSLQESNQDYVEVWSVSRREKTTKKEVKRIAKIEDQWHLPTPIMLFLSNLPKSVVAFPFYSLEKVIAQIEEIYDDKFASDQVDASDGVAREELPKFICEFFLKADGLRQSAEVALYRLLISVKNLYRRNSHVKLFARFLNLLQDGSDEDDDATHPTHAEPTGPSSHAPSKKKRTGYLNISFLHVFLTARYYLQRPPPPAPHSTTRAKGTTAKRKASADLPHVIQLEPTKKWVSLDHAITILKWYISYLPEESVVSYCREVEYSTAIYAGGVLTEVSGNRLAVRAEMRRAMLANPGSESGSNVSDDNDRRPKPRIAADIHKVLLLLLDALEQRQDVMERDLIALFAAGDTNHDCVLSFTEFKAIIKTRVPHFSDRRILRMFREALMGGADQSFALSMDAFVLVCGDHGLVSLLPDDRLQDPLLSSAGKQFTALNGTEKGVRSVIKLSSALDALVAAKPSRPSGAADSEESVAILDLPGPDIPEELPVDATGADEGENLPSARAEEVEDDKTWGW